VLCAVFMPPVRASPLDPSPATAHTTQHTHTPPPANCMLDEGDPHVSLDEAEVEVFNFFLLTLAQLGTENLPNTISVPIVMNRNGN
jgi:hypothetical protein